MFVKKSLKNYQPELSTHTWSWSEESLDTRCPVQSAPPSTSPHAGILRKLILLVNPLSFAKKCRRVSFLLSISKLHFPVMDGNSCPHTWCSFPMHTSEILVSGPVSDHLIPGDGSAVLAGVLPRSDGVWAAKHRGRFLPNGTSSPKDGLFPDVLSSVLLDETRAVESERCDGGAPRCWGGCRGCRDGAAEVRRIKWASQSFAGKISRGNTKPATLRKDLIGNFRFPADIEAEYRECMRHMRKAAPLPKDLAEAEAAVEEVERQLKEKVI